MDVESPGDDRWKMPNGKDRNLGRDDTKVMMLMLMMMMLMMMLMLLMMMMLMMMIDASCVMVAE